MSLDGAKAVRDIIHLGQEVQPRLCPLTADEFLRLELPPRHLIFDPWLPEKGLAMIYSLRGMGKTLLALTRLRHCKRLRLPRVQNCEGATGVVYRRRNACHDNAGAPCCHNHRFRAPAP